MITVISGTNRTDSNSCKVARMCQNFLLEMGEEVQLLDLNVLPHNLIEAEMYGNRSEEFEHELVTKIRNADRFYFVVAEYNGSFPGILKTFIDCVSPADWRGKRAAMVGVSSGRAGAMLAMSHLTDILHYLKVEVMSSKPKLSGIEQLLGDAGELTDQEARTLLNEHTKGFLSF